MEPIQRRRSGPDQTVAEMRLFKKYLGDW